MNTYDLLWLKILNDLESTFNEETYADVFEPLKSTHKYANGHVYVLVASEFIKNRINRLYLTKINELAAKYNGSPIRFKFVTESELLPEETLTSPERNLGLKYRPGNLNATYAFDNFVVGKSNMFAFRMAMKVADQPGAVANPLYIFGDVGLGKTHLMQAIGNYILDQNINQKVLYVKADGFIEDFANLLKKERMEDFNSKYRDIDILLVDDIQIMGGATKTQMEFFKLFDYLYQQNKQIVITSDKPASELKNIMTRLTSRFEVGLTVDIQVPDLEHRIEILKRKLATESSDIHDIPSEVLDFIASSFVTNIRELEGALKRVLFYCLTNNLELTVESVNEALEPLLKTKRKSDSLNENNYDRIQSIVSDFYGISLEDLIGKKRHSKYILPRHIAMFLIKSRYNIPYKTIGTLFGDRDHSTVLAACEKIDNDVKQDPTLRLAVDTIIKKVDSINKK
ncbi:MAG TPA: chromosomal replication initiator protein DnaA [Acholeplasmataceae bacterium]|nr:MAG: chromosomal replication initiator protein DnaA [Tenericutes bacterium GWD2_38_27]OHE40827.1 MAG: chromosomal replication initiator protein DnaA [Tenericutes bacterium GWE2_38_8]HBG32440.1 chromosomal replication initiator protein DnaA [Acholeplasmataceae bacterium]HBY65013.1 chromosomal replication initiator protein DnaA [Acholeplasmataceae bacterium]HCB66105.1 chromosomal replication initiator protein DnaA [Acholeplasmataceae bacterium]